MKLMIAMMVVVADLAFRPVTVQNVEPEPMQTEAQTEAYIPPRMEGTTYRIYGITPPEDWQRYLYAELDAKGYGWFMPYAVCQIFQESRWDQYSTNGIDVGLTQQKEVYWHTRAAHWGVPGASIWNPYAQLKVYAGMMCQFLAQTGSVEWALSLYFWGNGDYAPIYIADVMSHWGALEVVR